MPEDAAGRGGVARAGGWATYTDLPRMPAVASLAVYVCGEGEGCTMTDMRTVDGEHARCYIRARSGVALVPCPLCVD